MFPFLKDWISFFGFLLYFLTLALCYNLADYFTNNWRKLESMAWATCTNQNLLRISYPINNKIISFSIGIIAFLNTFNSDKVLPKILQSLLSQLIVMVISCVFWCICIVRLMGSMLRKFDTKFFCSIAWNRVKHFTMFGKMCKWRILSYQKLALRF